jgi:K+-transporting ATPase ATPase C chain
MLKNLKSSILLTLILLVIFGVMYPVAMYGVGKLFPSNSEGSPVYKDGKIIGFENVGQSFTDDKYFWGRPSAVGYNAASTGGSNKGPTNPDYLAEVQARIDTFLVHNPGINKQDIPSELVTASGSGIDPDISPQGAYIQVKRVASARNLDENKVKELVKQNIKTPLLGPPVVNVLKLNLSLDELK